MRGEIEYGVKAIPAGGYVKIAGMNPYETVAPEDLPRTFGAKPIWQRSLVILAGPATHFVLAFLCFGVWLGFVGQPVAKGVVITGVEPTLHGVEVAGGGGRAPGRRRRWSRSTASPIRPPTSWWRSPPPTQVSP